MSMTYSLKDVKKKGDKPGATPFEFFFLEPPSWPVTWVFANIVKVTPNTVTLLATVTVLAAAALIATNHFGWGMLVLYVGYVLDWCDGRLARLTKQTSELGAFWDHMGDTLRLITVVPAMVYYGYAISPNPLLIAAGFSYMVLLQMMHVLYAKSKEINKGKLLTKVMEEKSSHNPLVKLRIFFKKKRLLLSYSPVDTDGVAILIFPVLYLLTNKISMIYYGFVTGTALLAALYLLFLVLQLKMRKK